ncbi:hypothetical protein FHETE_4997 [Fusarium heterosporum]|uniref:Uncharacterized protein n=1 Tax=Fusarium heterosporum TaxID=42747 RepID=A0A8H5THM0_FUSHE|nr:hypothetical protein FHETE_4997 [Fusarium heterosporum]
MTPTQTFDLPPASELNLTKKTKRDTRLPEYKGDDETESYYWPFYEWSLIYRWAGYVAPRPVPVSFNQDVVADLTFNDMTLMETGGKSKNENGEFQLDTNDLPHHIEDESLDAGDTSQQDAEPSTTSIENKKGEKREVANKSLELVPPSASHSVDHDIGGELRSSKETFQTSDSESPEMALRRLIETGIFDGTHILNEIMDRVIRQDSAEGNVSNGGQENNPRYQHKGVLANPNIDTNLELSSKSSLSAKICNQDDASLTTASANIIDYEPRRSEVPLYTHSTTQVDSAALARAPAGNDLHGCGTSRNFMVENRAKELIEIIENEASLRWNGSRQTSNGPYVDGIENIAESEFPGVQDGHGAFQGGDLEYHEAARSGLQTMRVGRSYEPDFERSQRGLEDWRNLDNQQGHHSANRTDRELDVSELEMLSFWRPNHF